MSPRRHENKATKLLRVYDKVTVAVDASDPRRAVIQRLYTA